jgi:hypothetical protein
MNYRQLHHIDRLEDDVHKQGYDEDLERQQFTVLLGRVLIDFHYLQVDA